MGKFPRVIAADVLYEPTYGDLVANAIAVTLAADGRATVADPGRLSRDNFIAAAKELGLNVDLSRKVKFAEGEVRQEITLIDLRWPLGPIGRERAQRSGNRQSNHGTPSLRSG